MELWMRKMFYRDKESGLKHDRGEIEILLPQDLLRMYCF